MQELVFIVTESPDGGFTAHCSSTSIHTEADTMEELNISIKNAVECHFDYHEKNRLIKLMYKSPQPQRQNNH
jgi:predicted RNase H-like HicB family nuclease